MCPHIKCVFLKLLTSLRFFGTNSFKEIVIRHKREEGVENAKSFIRKLELFYFFKSKNQSKGNLFIINLTLISFIIYLTYFSRKGTQVCLTLCNKLPMNLYVLAPLKTLLISKFIILFSLDSFVSAFPQHVRLSLLSVKV